MKKIKLSEKLEQVLSTTKNRIELLHEIGVFAVKDFLGLYPRTHEMQNTAEISSDIRLDQKNILKGEFSNVTSSRGKSRILVTKAIFTTPKGESFECVWFNQPHIKKMLPVGRMLVVSTKAKSAYGKITLQNPSFTDQEINSGEITPVYREHGKLSADWFRKKMFHLIDIVEDFPEIIPEKIRKEENLIPKNEAIQIIHFPKNEEELKKAKKALAFEELFVLQLAGILRKKKWQSETSGKSKKIPLDPDLQKQFFKTLPFELTGGQKVALFEILKDFEGDYPALRLLEGDVGSGKTVVAVGASLPILKQKMQVAFLAPTEVLANQHYKSISKLLEKFNPEIKTELLTGAIKGKKREEILEGIRKGSIQALVGTHALIQESVIWHNLGFCVIDEQHRFGVEQRSHLLKQGYPHVLQMTATPIPRTLAIVAFGDQDLSVISELPSGRKPIITKVVANSARSQTELFIESEIKKGRQGFVICPLVEGSDNIQAKAVTEEFERLKKDVFPNLRLALLHGRMKSKEKKEIMEAFSAGEYDILVSTAVVEVGVDVPNATLMLIEGAERFGLAQLHQFRGRVGRGEYQSYCFLFPTDDMGITQRLRAMEQYDDGFRLAEIDLHLRGPGEVFGIRQSGIPDLKMASLFDARIISSARKQAEEYANNVAYDDFSFALQKELKNKEKDDIERA